MTEDSCVQTPSYATTSTRILGSTLRKELVSKCSEVEKSVGETFWVAVSWCENCALAALFTFSTKVFKICPFFLGTPYFAFLARSKMWSRILVRVSALWRSIYLLARKSCHYVEVHNLSFSLRNAKLFLDRHRTMLYNLSWSGSFSSSWPIVFPVSNLLHTSNHWK